MVAFIRQSRLATPICARHFSTSVSPFAELPLFYETVGNQNSSKKIVFVHGLLGSGRNLRRFANEFSIQQDAQGFVVDLPGHGQSRGRRGSFSSAVENCVEDLHETLDGLGITAREDWILVGHSMGGRISLKYTDPVFVPELERSRPRRLVLLDTVPRAITPSVVNVLNVARDARVPWQEKKVDEFKPSHQDLMNLFTEVHQLDVPTANWLASSVDYEQRDFVFDVKMARALLRDMSNLCECMYFYFQQVRRILDVTSTKRVDLVRGGRNQAWKQPLVVEQLRNLEVVAEESKERNDGKSFHLRILPTAGHWLHSDDESGLLEALD